ncbi:MAG: GNAT family N-acetyltransferase [Pseudomonadota bacterium]
MTAIGTCELRLARPDDARLLARMSRDYIEQGLNWRWKPSALARKIRHPETVVLVAELDVGGVRFIGGFAVMDFELGGAMEKAQLTLLAVHPNIRRRNIGSQLLRWLHKSARVAGCEHIELQVRSDNHTARRFYQKFGYQEEALIPGYYDGKQAAYQMKLRLRDR